METGGGVRGAEVVAGMEVRGRAAMDAACLWGAVVGSGCHVGGAAHQGMDTIIPLK